jgi:phosphate uptake regulator
MLQGHKVSYTSKGVQVWIMDFEIVNHVAYTLLARYFKRISSHLVNIATSVVTSVDNLDYLDES